MSLQISVKFEGGKELENALKQLPKALAKSALLAGLKKSVKPVIDDARSLAPKRTGKGAKSIKARKNKELKPIGISVGPDQDHFYMKFTEFGTIKQPARPFLRPAWDANKDKILKDFGKIMWKILEKKAKTLAAKAQKGTLSKSSLKGLS